MGKVLESIDATLERWIMRQPMLFVGSAPGEGGRVNVSPKGPIGSLQVLGPHEIAYLDVFGSGAETIAHLRDNGRIVVMLCAFEGPPKIVRLHGTGEVLLAGEERFEELVGRRLFADLGPPEARRAVIRIDVERVSQSCGYGVPLMSVEGERRHYELSVGKKVRTKGAGAYVAAAQERNARSIDGLPSVPAA